MKTIQDQIKDLRNTRAHKAAQMEEVAKKAIEEGRSMDAAEREEFDTLRDEIKQLDEDLARYEELEKLNVQKAAPVQQRKVESDPAPARGPTIIVNREADEKFKGQNYTRIVIAKALARLDEVSPVVVAEKRWGKSNPMLVEVVKAAVQGGGSATGQWGAELTQADTRFTGDFIEYLYSRTVFDQLAFREVPANVTIKGQDGAATGYWTGENQPIKVSKADFSTVNLTPLKVAALAVVSNELLRDSSPAAEQLVRDALVEACAQRIDSTVFSAAGAGSGAPAGLLNGVVPIAATGLDADAVYDGIRSLYAPFIAAKNASGLVYVMNPARAKAISLLRNALGQKEFPDLGATGGLLDGDTVVTGDNINEAHVILLKPSDIWKIGDGGIEVSFSRDATIEQADDPTGETKEGTAMSKNLTSMFQTESTAIKVVRSINFAKRRASAVAYVGDASWGDSAS